MTELRALPRSAQDSAIYRSHLMIDIVLLTGPDSKRLTRTACLLAAAMCERASPRLLSPSRPHPTIRTAEDDRFFCRRRARVKKRFDKADDEWKSN